MGGNLSKSDIENLKKMKVTVKMYDGNSGLEVSVKHPAKILDYDYKRKDGEQTISFCIDKSPTNNCQLAAFKSFYNMLLLFKEDDKRNEDQKFNARMKQLAFLRGMAVLFLDKHFGKRLFFVDVKQQYWHHLDNMNKYLFTRRNKKNDHPYTSTNTSRMVTTLLQIDTEKLKKYYSDKKN